MSKKYQEYSQLALAVDLVMNEYKVSNPIEIVELIQQDLSLYFTVHQVMDYLDINKKEDYEKGITKTTISILLKMRKLFELNLDFNIWYKNQLVYEFKRSKIDRDSDKDFLYEMGILMVFLISAWLIYLYF